MNITRSQLKAQYDRAVKLGWLPFFQEAADTITKGYFDAADLMGIGSRETNLDPKWLRQLGDGGHAGGLMQADIRSFPDFISSGQWKDARQSILFGARVLMLKWQDYEAHIGMTLSVKGKSYTAKKAEGSTAQHIVISSYNCGRWSQYCYAHDIDIDKYSTGHDYGSDVMERSSVLRTFFPISAAVSPGNSTDTSENEPPDTALEPPVPSPISQQAETIVNTGDQSAPTPSPTDVNVVAAKPSWKTTAGAALTALWGYYQLAKANFSDLVDRATGAIDAHLLANIFVGAAFVAIAYWLYNHSQQRAHEKTLELIKAASDPALNNVNLK